MFRIALACVLASGCNFAFPLRDRGDIELPDGGSTADAIATDGSLPDAAASCPGSYNLLGKYRFSAQGLPFAAAQADCVSDQVANSTVSFTHLAVFDDLTELNELSISNADLRWLGFRREPPDDTFRPITTQKTQFPPPSPGDPWRSGEPTDGANCLAFDDGGVLDAVDCTEDVLFVCECDTFGPAL